MMNYQPIEFILHRDNEELLTLILLNHGITTIEIIDNKDWNDIYNDHDEWIVIEEPKEETDDIIMRCYVEEDQQEIVDSLKEASKGLVDEMNLLEMAQDEDYIQQARENFDQIFVRDFIITPSWKEYSGDKMKIILDPGMAFGTGQHETTKLSLDLMQDIDIKGKRVFDIGTGSGILAIGASLLGASEIEACDIDEGAVKAAKENAKVNNIHNIKSFYGDLLEFGSGKYDLIISNILSGIIIELLEDLPSYIHKDSQMIFSGILVEEKDKMTEVFKEAGFSILKEKEEGDWIGFLLEVNNA